MRQVPRAGFSLLPLPALALAALTFYLSPGLALPVLAAAAFVALAWWRLDLALLSIPITAPLFRFPKTLEAGGVLGRDAALEISMVEFALCACVIAWALRFPRLAGGAGGGGGRWNQGEAATGHAEGAGGGGSGAGPAEASRRGAAGPFSRRHLRRFPVQKPTITRTALVPPAVLIAIALVSLPLSANQQVALREFRVVVLEPSLYYLLVVSTLRSSAGVGRLLWVLVATGAAVAAYTFYDYLFVGITTDTGGVRRALAIYHSPNALALFLGRIIPIAAALSLPLLSRAAAPLSLRGDPQGTPVAIWGSQAAAVTLLLMLAATAITFSRGAFLGIAAALGFLLIAAYRFPPTTTPSSPAFNRRTALLGGAVVCLAVVVSLPFLPLDRLGESSTIAQRLYLWQAAIAMAADHPITGVGLDNFLYQYPRYMLPEAALEPNMSHPHNLFLDFLTRLGILGLAALAWLQYLFWRNGAALLRTALSPQERLYVLALMGSMVGFLVHGLIDNSYFLIDLAYLFWLSLALLAVLALHPTSPKTAGQAA